MRPDSNANNYALVEFVARRCGSEMAFQLATPLIDQGDASTQWFLGHLCHNGLYGMEVDLKSAGEWYRKAAAQGYARAVEALGGLRSGRAGEAIRLGAVRGANQKVIEVPARTWLNLGEDDCEVITPCSREHCKVAFRWYVAAGKRGDVEAQIALPRVANIFLRKYAGDLGRRQRIRSRPSNGIGSSRRTEILMPNGSFPSHTHVA
jgi:TPR repeat protein